MHDGPLEPALGDPGWSDEDPQRAAARRAFYQALKAADPETRLFVRRQLEALARRLANRRDDQA